MSGRSGSIQGENLDGVYISKADQELFSETLKYAIDIMKEVSASKGHLTRIRQLNDLMLGEQEEPESHRLSKPTRIRKLA